MVQFNKTVMSALKYYHQSINATLRSRYKKLGKVYDSKSFEPEHWSEDKIKTAIKTYDKHKNYLKAKRAEKKAGNSK